MYSVTTNLCVGWCVRACVGGWVRVRACVCVWVGGWVRACVCVCVSVCVRALGTFCNVWGEGAGEAGDVADEVAAPARAHTYGRKRQIQMKRGAAETGQEKQIETCRGRHMGEADRDMQRQTLA